jgi:hypothetical protein
MTSSQVSARKEIVSQNFFKRSKVFEILILKLWIVIYLTSSCVNWAFFGMSGPV